MNTKSLFTALGLFLSVALGVSGSISRMNWSTLSNPDRYNQLVLLAAYFILVMVIMVYGKRGAILGGLTIVLFVATLLGKILPLFVAIWFIISAIAFGSILVPKILTQRNDLTQILFSFLVGAGIYGTIVSLIAHFPINYSGLYVLMTLLPVILKQNLIIELAKATYGYFDQKNHHKIDWLAAIIVSIALVHFSVTLMPEVGYDALATHLFIPHHLSIFHQWQFDVSKYIWAAMPAIGDWVFSIVYMLGGEQAVKFVNLVFVFASMLLVRGLVLWAGGTISGARWAVLISLSTPLIFLESSTVFIDMVWTAFLCAGFFAVVRVCYDDNYKKDYLLIAAIYLGLAMASKAVTLVILPILLFILIVNYKSWLGRNFYNIILISLTIFLFIGSIPYLRAYLLSGNPVLPFFNKFFQSPYYPPENFVDAFREGIKWDMLYRITFNSYRYIEGYKGSSGFQWLFLLIPSLLVVVFAKQNKALMMFLFGIVSVIVTFYFTAYLRYIIPALIIISAAIGVVFSHIQYNKVWLRRSFYFAATLAVILNLLFLKAAGHNSQLALEPLLGEVEKRSYLQSRLPIRNAVEIINAININNDQVAFFAPPIVAGLTADALFCDWYNPSFSLAIRGAIDQGAIAKILTDYKVGYFVIDKDWPGLDAPKKLLISSLGYKIADVGSVSVYKFIQE